MNRFPQWNKAQGVVSMEYADFLAAKQQQCGNDGFDPVWMPDWLFDFQRHLVEWSLRKGRALIAADCGLGKTPMQLVWAENVRRHTGRPVITEAKELRRQVEYGEISPPVRCVIVREEQSND